MIDRELHLFVRQIGNGDEFVITISEPTGGYNTDLIYAWSPEENKEFNQRLANEVLSWIDLWKAQEKDDWG